MNKGLFFGSLIVVAVTGSAIVAYSNAPVTRALKGFVTDSLGQPIPGATVDLFDQAKKETTALRTTVTDGRGWFSFPDLLESRYRVVARTSTGRMGFAGDLVPGMTLELMVGGMAAPPISTKTPSAEAAEKR